MKRELIASVVVLVAGMVIAGAIVAVPALAQERSAPNIQFPVAELGNCTSEVTCKRYCDDPAHIEACIAFAEAHGLMSREERAVARRFAAAGFEGPGGCNSRESCEAYCDNITNINECVAFAEAQGFLPPEELAEAKQVQSAIARGVTPPACSNKRTCETYCRAPAHMQECIAFGEAAGFIKGQELEDARKVLGAIERGVTPPPCGGKKECDAYCAEEANFPQCLAFGEAAGFISPEEAARARKTGGKGPGNCRGREECEAFCQNPSNQEACFAFGKEHGLIPEADLRRMEEGKAKFVEGLQQAPPGVAECLKSTVGEEVLNKIAAGQGFPPRDLGEKMRACFENFKPPGDFQGPPGSMPPGAPVGFDMPSGQFSGPGGCVSSEECRAYCEKNPEACGANVRPQPPEGFQPPSPPPGTVPPEGFPGQFQDQYQKQYEEQYRQQYEQYQQGAYPPPPGTYPPPPEFQPAPPPASLGPQALLGLFLNIFTGR